MENSNNFNKLEKLLDYKFENHNLLDTALTHSSLVKDLCGDDAEKVKDYERLEFLGDSILSFIVSEYLYDIYPNEDEGVLSKVRACVVCEGSLSEIASKLSFSEFIKTGKSEKNGNIPVRTSILADVYEAILAAMYLDKGIAHAKKFVISTLKTKIDNTLIARDYSDYKTKLQELVFANYGNTVSYEIVRESGPDHAKTFDAIVKHNSKIVGSGTGKSKKQAEQSAAKMAIENLEKQIHINWG